MKFRFTMRRFGALIFICFLSGCSPQWIKEQVKARVAARRQARPKTPIPTRLEWRSRPPVPKAGLPALWGLKILDLRTDKLHPKGIRTYDAPRAVAMHLFIVSRDGSQYAHLYPEPRDYGNFLARPVIPRGGAYQLWVDFMPIDGYATSHSQRFLVAGDSRFSEQEWQPDQAQNGWLETMAQAREEQSFAPKPDAPTYVAQMQQRNWQAKQPIEFQARLLNEDKTPVAALLPHLSGAAYGIAISQDGEHFVRLEAPETAENSVQNNHQTTFRGTFPAKGLYEIWLEFRPAPHKNQIVVAPFTIRVSETKKQKPKTKDPT